MATVGEILRRERERQGLSIAHIAQQTRIKVQFLEALERDNFAVLPGVFFARAFTTQYAKFLGMPDAELHAALERQVAAPDVSLVQISSSLYLAEERALSKPALDPLPEGTASAIGARKLTASVVALAAVIIGCGTIFWLWQRSQLGFTSANATPESQPVTVIKGGSGISPQQPVSPPPVQPTNPSAKADASPATPSPAAPNPAAAVQAGTPGSTTPTSTAQQTPAPEPVGAPVVPGKLNLSISSKEDTWVRITTDGKVVLARVITPTEPLVTAVANENARILLGNAGGVVIRFNGSDIGAVGPRGQVRTVEFTPAGFNVLLPPPKTPPAEGAAEPKPQNPAPNTGE